MAWTTPRTWVTGEVVTASIMNAHVRDNLNAITDGYYIQAKQFDSAIGTPTLGLVGSAGGNQAVAAWQFDPTAVEAINTALLLPSALHSVNVNATIYWAPATTNTGSVKWGLHAVGIDNAEQIDQSYDDIDTVTQAASGTADNLHITSAMSKTTLTDGVNRIMVERQATDGADTFTGDAWLLGVHLQPA